MKYFFVLGNHPSLSVAEIASVLRAKVSYQLVNNQILIVSSKTALKVPELMSHLGGTIKIGIIFDQVKIKEKILTAIKPVLKPTEGKFKYGLSYYGIGQMNFKVLAMEIKKYLKSKEVSCRWVTSKEDTLSSVVVEQNKLTSKGIEIVVIKDALSFLIGKTLAVQPFKELSKRDYGRPARDDYSGMLPPKLAQIMINLAKLSPQQVMLDPFCGSGTVLTEGLLLGLHQVIGSDLSNKAVKDSQTNIEWIINNYNLENRDYQLYCHSADDLSSVIKHDLIDAIVTEPYLGPQRGNINIKKVKSDLEKIYYRSLKQFAKIIKKSGYVVMVWPVFCHAQHRFDYLNIDLGEFKIVNLLPLELSAKDLSLTYRKTFLYGRPGQKVWREIVVLKRK